MAKNGFKNDKLILLIACNPLQKSLLVNTAAWMEKNTICSYQYFVIKTNSTRTLFIKHP